MGKLHEWPTVLAASVLTSHRPVMQHKKCILFYTFSLFPLTSLSAIVWTEIEAVDGLLD